MSVKLAYTFGDDMPYPRNSYVVIETVELDQQRAAATAIFGLTPSKAVNFAFDYPLDEFEYGSDARPSQVLKWGYLKAAEFSLLPKPPEPSDDELQSLYLEAVVDSCRVIDGEHISEAVLDMVREETSRHMPTPVGLRAVWESAR